MSPYDTLLAHTRWRGVHEFIGVEAIRGFIMNGHQEELNTATRWQMTVLANTKDFRGSTHGFGEESAIVLFFLS